MSIHASRRQFIQTAAAGCFLGVQLPRVSADQTKLDPGVVRLDSGIEPLVRVLEETPRDRLIEEMALRVQKGLPYRDVLAALLLAGVRNVEPRPSVGFKFHAVLVVNSAHLASIASPDEDRWLPIFWALDNFKSSQERNQSERAGWRMPPVNEANVPPARKARAAFITAMDNWDAGAADVAIASLVRHSGVDEVAELLWRFGARDFRDIGHKIIFAANVRRTLSVIGWQHAEPVLRSLAYAMLAANGNPAKGDEPADRPGRRNRELATGIGADWIDGKPDAAATTEMLAGLRKNSAEDSSKQVVELLNKHVSPRSIWDGILGGAIELLMRRPGIVSLHAVTTTNALRFAFESSADDETRRWLLLQNAAYITLFRDELTRRKESLDGARFDALEPLPTSAKGPQAIEEIFANLSKDKSTAARMVIGYLNDNPNPRPITDAARRLIFRKGTDSHDYKFSAAVLEDYAIMSPELQKRYLASSMFWLKGSGERDSSLVARIRDAFRA